jgi:hypothetical protein
MMRVGVRVGPFYASSSTRGCAPIVVTFFVLLAIVSLAIDHPRVSIPVGVVLFTLVARLVQLRVAVWRSQRRADRSFRGGSSEVARRDAELRRCAWCGREAGRHWSDCPAEGTS